MNKFAVRTGAVACALVAVPSVYAQTNEQAGRQLEEVVVTAHVPLAVAFSAMAAYA